MTIPLPDDDELAMACDTLGDRGLDHLADLFTRLVMAERAQIRIMAQWKTSSWCRTAFSDAMDDAHRMAMAIRDRKTTEDQP